MLYDFKEYLNDTKKTIEYGLNYTFDSLNDFHSILERVFGFINNSSDFDLFLETELADILDKRILWGDTPVDLSKQKIKECIIKHSLTHSFDSAIEKIRQWLDGYDLYYIVPICGIFTHDVISLTDKISLISIEHLQSCRLKMDMINRMNSNLSWAECFLKIKIGNYKLISKSNQEEFRLVREQYNNDFEDATKTLKYIFPILPVVVGNGCIPHREAIYLIDGLYYDNQSIVNAPEFLQRLQNTNYKYISGTNENNVCIEIINQYLSLPDNIKNNLIPAFEYYNKYLLCYNTHYADAAIFLRIALETLLLDGFGPKKFQVSHRAAYLLNSNIGTVCNCNDNGFKDDVYRFSALYSMTSTFIHGDDSYDPSSVGFGYTSVSQGYLSSLTSPVRRIIVNYIRALEVQSPQITNEKYYNDYIFEGKIETIKRNSTCDDKKCIEFKNYIEKAINELLSYEANGYSKDRYMLFKLFNDKLEEKSYDYARSVRNGKNPDPHPFKDLSNKPVRFDSIRESSKRFLTAVLENYYKRIECTDVPNWITDYKAVASDTWINLNDEVVLREIDTSGVAKHYADRKLFPTAMRM